ncbi:hypothetical protein TNCV_907361 [Trichonephila clavipes]|nr:hypothetical protein TNCV_907361 [Trichonephila clavipes]
MSPKRIKTGKPEIKTNLLKIAEVFPLSHYIGMQKQVTRTKRNPTVEEVIINFLPDAIKENVERGILVNDPHQFQSIRSSPGEREEKREFLEKKDCN